MATSFWTPNRVVPGSRMVPLVLGTPQCVGCQMCLFHLGSVTGAIPPSGAWVMWYTAVTAVASIVMLMTVPFVLSPIMPELGTIILVVLEVAILVLGVLQRDVRHPAFDVHAGFQTRHGDQLCLLGAVPTTPCNGVLQALGVPRWVRWACRVG